MNKLFALAGAAVLLGTGMVGCSHTDEGMKQDTAENGAKVEKAADTAATKTVEGTEKAGAAIEKGAANTAAAGEKAAADVAAGTQKAAAGVEKAAADAGQSVKHGVKVATMTPKVKSALLNDTTLSPADKPTLNSFNVDTDSDGVTIHLKGHVQTNEMKKKAEQVAKDAVKGETTQYKISNELTVEKH